MIKILERLKNWTKETGPDCKCRIDCFSKFDSENKKNILNVLNSLCNVIELDIFLQQLIENTKSYTFGGNKI